MKVAGKIVILLVTLYLAAAPAYFTNRMNQVRLNGVAVEISDSAVNNLITGHDILRIVYSTNPKIAGSRVREIRICDIEERIRELRELKVAEVIYTVDGTLKVYVQQRTPVMRVITKSGDYYIDDEGVLIRKLKLYPPRLHIVSGNINITKPMADGVSILDTVNKNSVLRDIFHFVNYIRNNRFWSAEIDQIWVDNKGGIDIIPRTGRHVVHLGSAENFKEKLENLEEFYLRVLPVAGWDAYKRINLEYRGQIVCNRNQ